MNCDAARERVLEANLAELEGQGEGDLAAHLQSCERCRGQARAILNQYAALRSALERQAPHLNPADPRWQRRIAPSPRRRWAVVVPLALAAGLAILVVGRPWRTGLPPRTTVSTPPPAPPGLDVQGAPGHMVAVFQTDNPDIVVIWSF